MRKKHSVLTIIVHKTKGLLLQHRDEHAPRYANSWSLWGGGIEKGETPAQATRRELWEELRINVTPEELTPFKVYENEDHIRHVFILQDKHEYDYELHEGDDFGWFTDVPEGTNSLARMMLEDYQKQNADQK